MFFSKLRNIPWQTLLQEKKDVLLVSMWMALCVYVRDVVFFDGYWCLLLLAFLLHVDMLERTQKPMLYKGLFGLGMLAIYATLLWSQKSFVIFTTWEIVMCFLGVGWIYYFFNPRSDAYIDEFLERIGQIFISEVYVFTIAFSVKLILYFVDSIFLTSLFFKESITDILQAVCVFVGVMVVFSFQYVQRERGAFYRMLFGKILPFLCLVVGGLALIYLVCMLAGVRPDTAFLFNYYPYMVCFYFFYLLGAAVQEERWYSRLRPYMQGLFVILSLVASVYILVRMMRMPSQHVSGIYGLLCNLCFAGYNAWLLYKKRCIDTHFTKLLLVILLIIITPFIGFVAYRHVVEYTPIREYQEVEDGKLVDRTDYAASYQLSKALLQTEPMSYYVSLQQTKKETRTDVAESQGTYYRVVRLFKPASSHEGYVLPEGTYTYIETPVTVYKGGYIERQGVRLSLEDDGKTLRLARLKERLGKTESSRMRDEELADERETLGTVNIFENYEKEEEPIRYSWRVNTRSVWDYVGGDTIRSTQAEVYSEMLPRPWEIALGGGYYFYVTEYTYRALVENGAESSVLEARIEGILVQRKE